MSKSLNKSIGSFYDASTPVWLDVWGEHMHHGFYDPDNNDLPPQILLIEKLLQFGGVEAPKHILDAGCGVGGSSRYLAKKFSARSLGVTLSEVQARRGTDINIKTGLSDLVTLDACDMMKISKPPMSFDLIWSLESAEHIRDKRQLMSNFYDLLKPGGHLIMATWCHRETPPNLAKTELALMAKLGKLYHLPPLTSITMLKDIAIDLGYQSVAIADWSDEVSPFWDHVIKSVFHWKSLIGLSRAGITTIKGAWAMRYMKKGYRMGTLKFGVLSAVKK